MKKGFICVVFLLFFVACTDSNKVNGGLLTISLDESVKDDMSFLESIKVVPLETLDTALVKKLNLFN